jgi:magnesium chelatase family protein
LLDRIDIHIEAPRVEYEKLSSDRVSETSASILQWMQAARDIQHTRFTNSDSQSTDVLCNADMRVGEVRRFCQLHAEGQSLMRATMSQLNLSARACHRLLKLSRAIADLAGSKEIQSTVLATSVTRQELCDKTNWRRYLTELLSNPENLAGEASRQESHLKNYLTTKARDGKLK